MGVYLQPSPRPLLTGLSFSVGSVAIETKIDVCSQLSRFVCIFRGAKLAHAGKGEGLTHKRLLNMLLLDGLLGYAWGL